MKTLLLIRHAKSSWNDPALGIDWPIVGEPIVAAKDAAGVPLASAETYA